LSNGRGAELESDQLGAEYLSRSGYDAKTMINVIRVLRAQEQFAQDEAARSGKAAQQRMPNWLATHPSNDRRLSEITEIAAKYPVTNADAGRERYLRVIDGMTFGDSKDQGVIRRDTFYHEGLGVTLKAPAGWKLQNSPEQLLLVNPEGTAGVIMQLATGQGQNPEEIVRKVLKPTQGNFTQGNVNGFAATYFSGLRQSQQGSAVVESAVVRANNSGSIQDYLFVLVGKDNQAMQANRGQAAQLVQTFRAMNAQDKTAAKPYVLRTVNRNSVAGLAQRSPLGREGEDRIRLLNGVYPKGEPSAALAKTVE
jgi:predicted Zn-dependent protease